MWLPILCRFSWWATNKSINEHHKTIVIYVISIPPTNQTLSNFFIPFSGKKKEFCHLQFWQKKIKRKKQQQNFKKVTCHVLLVPNWHKLMKFTPASVRVFVDQTLFLGSNLEKEKFSFLKFSKWSSKQQNFDLWNFIILKFNIKFDFIQTVNFVYKDI